MRAYIIRRLLLMIPTLFGVTLVTFIVMQFAPGDPLKQQLSQAGSQGESGSTREAFLHQRKQWKLDKPALLNTRWFTDFSRDARFCAELTGVTDEALRERLGVLKAGAGKAEIAELLQFLRGLEIEGFDDQLNDENRHADLAKRIKLGVQIRVEEGIADHGVNAFEALLNEKDLPIRIGAIRCLMMCTLGDPFVYTYSKEPQDEETAAVVSTWRIWWERNREKLPAPPPERLQVLKKTFQELVAEPSRGKILEGVSEFTKEDGPFFAPILLDVSSLKEKYVASLALKAALGRPLKSDVKQTDKETTVAAVAENWKAYVRASQDRFSPPFLTRLWYLFADTQYANSLYKLVTFNFGRSMVKPYDPVGPEILRAAKVSAPIMLLSEAIVYLLAIPFGVYSAVRRNQWQDRTISTMLFVLYSIPPVVLGMLFLTFFAYGQFLKWFPMFGLHSEGHEGFGPFKGFTDYLWHIAGPMLCLSLSQIASLAMFGRSSMLDVVGQDYIRTARAKGLDGRTVIMKHALRNALIPVITLFSNFIPLLLGGSVIIEYLFGIPGMGRLSYDSIQNKDYNTVMALIYLDAIIVMLSILLSDMLYIVVDPRISFSKSEGGA
ncbi:MAG TPA: ABC transporter permease subunit [Planctomycetota bacterium]|nr:ABC transporter permease subunit [Planctomycetota bacterium]